MSTDRTDPRGVESRNRLVDAGWELLDEIRLADLFSALTVGAICERAERSPRTFWNHFPDWQAYVECLVAEIPRLRRLEEGEPWLPIEVVREALDGVERTDLPGLIDRATVDNWQAIHEPEDLAGFMRQLLLLSRVPREPGLGEVLLRDYWGMHHSRYTQIYEVTGQALEVEPIPPIGWPELARVLNALEEGIERMWMCGEDETIPPELPHATAALALALMRPAGSTIGMESRRASLLARAEPALLGDHDAEALTTACRDTVDAMRSEHGDMAGAASDPGWPHNLWAALALATGEPELNLRDGLQRPEMVGALAFSRWLPLEVAPRSNAPDNPRETRAADWLCALARTARGDPWCAHAFLAERLRPGGDAGRLRHTVDPGAAFADLVGGQRRSGHDRAINIVLTAALSDHSATPAAIAEAAVAGMPSITEPGPA